MRDFREETSTGCLSLLCGMFPLRMNACQCEETNSQLDGAVW